MNEVCSTFTSMSSRTLLSDHVCVHIYTKTAEELPDFVFKPEDGGRKIIRNVDNKVPNYTQSHAERQ